MIDQEMVPELKNSELSAEGSNVVLLPGTKKKAKTNGKDKVKVRLPPQLSKAQKHKLMKLQEEKQKRAMELKSIEILKKHSIKDDVYSLLNSSGTIGQVETMREKRRRAVQFSKVGLELPPDDPPVKKSRIQEDQENAVLVSIGEENEYSDRHWVLDKKDYSGQCEDQDNALKQSCSAVHPLVGSQIVSLVPETCGRDTLTYLQEGRNNSSITSSACDVQNDNNLQDMEKRDSPKVLQNISSLAGSTLLRCINKKEVVHVSRPSEVESNRANLPIVMMEQEIMEAINENPSTIVCGETGCGKTTQVPQFLYEAGFGSNSCTGKQGIIGVTQPRRVAVLATAKRVAYELGLGLGKEVGFQVRHDKLIGASCSIKFMTDGILLREVQSDFLLRHYSVIILDEAHERSLNTDILVGMLSRVIEERQREYAKQQEKVLSGINIRPEYMISPLKLILMSATLRVEDFILNKRLFRQPPPVIDVPTRQFPVTIHFSKRTEIVDYVGQAYKKVISIHKRLPPGGILVFVTGQREVEYLCKKLRNASRQWVQKFSYHNGNSEVPPQCSQTEESEGFNMKDISEAFETDGRGYGNQTGRFNSLDEDSNDFERDSNSSDLGTESEQEAETDESDLSSNEEEEINMEEHLFKEPGSYASLKAAFEVLAGKKIKNESEEKPKPVPSTTDPNKIEGKHEKERSSPGGLQVLPLYAMLPPSQQLRVFDNVREGERLVVVATNVAETSLTIPGIKYVVDTGREKVKNYNYANGMATYEVQRISKASGAQRAGRAGRTGPGHCYRLYSSAVFNNQFSDFSGAEITTIPVDGVVLQLKSMGIHKVANFPFPTPPKTEAVKDAERCLEALGALDKEGRLTAIGEAMAKFPMSPHHSRMLLTVFQMMRRKRNYARANLVLGYAIGVSAALSFSNPFIMRIGGSQQYKDGIGQDGMNNEFLGELGRDVTVDSGRVHDFEEKLKQKKLKEAAKKARENFRNSSSDALTVAYALQLFELSENQEEFCSTSGLHFKTMDEMSKLRKQVLQLILYHNSVGGFPHDFSWAQDNPEDIERAWRVSSEKHPLLSYEEELLGQAICAGWADRVAKRTRVATESLDKDRKVGAVRYQACMVNETVFLHRWSSVSLSAPEFLVYNELLQTKRPYMHGVTRVKPEWLVKYARPMCTFSSPLADPKPYYEPLEDQAFCWVRPTFGPHLWQLRATGVPIKDEVLRVSVFACALLEGKVLPCLRSAQKFLAAPPASLLRPEANGQRRVGNLLHKLHNKSRTIDSRAMLRKAWDENPDELCLEIQHWFHKSFHDKFKDLWEKMHQEIIVGARDLFPEKEKKRSKCLPVKMNANGSD
ncbi:ATP-dependent RNA helicase DEAH13 [Aristolochia californica]|uniref:ATP-dependent RNA helicase DEAH13 n=1 Tax=Aristolochia californica TaxID=171875 RepID=UPI0035D7302D